MTDNFIMPFAGGAMDHAETRRSAEELQGFVKDPTAQCLVFLKGAPALNEDGSLKFMHPSNLIGRDLQDPGPIFLGLQKGVPIFSAALPHPQDLAPAESFQNMRAIAGRLSPSELALAGRAKSMLDWHYTHRYCANCGALSNGDEGGVKRNCPECGTEHFPRVNPVVIMLVLSGDKVLLGRGPGWPEGFMSALAGFVSPGETIEEATSRETFEEVGISVSNVRYLFSQPWPFPSQLMMGVTCEAQAEDIKLNTAELEEAKWFAKDEVKAVFAKQSDAFMRPPRFTIAHQLLRHWIEP